MAPAQEPDQFATPSEEIEQLTTRPRIVRATEPAPDPEIEIIDEPELELEPEPEPVFETCLPPEVSARLALEPAGLRACFNRRGNTSAADDACLWIGADGALRAGPPPDEPPAPPAPITISADGASATLCPVDGCPTVTPGRTIQQAVVDETGARAALLLQDGDDGAGTVELYDTHDGRRLASGTRRWKGGRVSYEIAFVEQAILWIEYPGAVDPGNAELWKTRGAVLKKRTSLKRTRAWASLGGERYVFGREGTILEVWNITKAKRTHKLDLKLLVVGAAERASWRALGEEVALATRDDGFAALAQSASAARVAFVDLSGRRARTSIVDVPICE